MADLDADVLDAPSLPHLAHLPGGVPPLVVGTAVRHQHHPRTVARDTGLAVEVAAGLEIGRRHPQCGAHARHSAGSERRQAVHARDGPEGNDARGAVVEGDDLQFDAHAGRLVAPRLLQELPDALVEFADRGAAHAARRVEQEDDRAARRGVGNVEGVVVGVVFHGPFGGCWFC